MPAKHYLQFQCDWAVYPAGGQTSVCYTTGQIQARLVAIALNRFLNTDEGEQWLKRHAS